MFYRQSLVYYILLDIKTRFTNYSHCELFPEKHLSHEGCEVVREFTSILFPGLIRIIKLSNSRSKITWRRGERPRTLLTIKPLIDSETRCHLTSFGKYELWPLWRLLSLLHKLRYTITMFNEVSVSILCCGIIRFQTCYSHRQFNRYPYSFFRVTGS